MVKKKRLSKLARKRSRVSNLKIVNDKNPKHISAKKNSKDTSVVPQSSPQEFGPRNKQIFNKNARNFQQNDFQIIKKIYFPM